MAYDPNDPKGHYDTSVTVPHSVIDEIRALGMEGAIQKAQSGNASPEFIEGVRRFYPNQFQGPEQETQLPPPPEDATGEEEMPVRNETGTATVAPASLPDLTPPSTQTSGNISQQAIMRAMQNAGPHSTASGPVGEVPSPSSTASTPGGAAARGEDWDREPIAPAIAEIFRKLTSSNPDSASGQTLGGARATGEEYDRQPFGPAIKSALSGIGNTLFPGDSGQETYAQKRQRELREARNR